MLLTITKTVALPTSTEEVWAVIRDPETVARCLPNIRDFRATGEPGRYTTVLVERLGPFGVQVALTIDVAEDAEARRMVATVAGDDKGGAARVRGDVRATVRPDGDLDGATLEVASDVEVLGRMATLGAVPMRRRGDQVFEQFVKNIASLLEERHA
jgi:carbon monoxide dehydrogenase subunit G